MAKEILIILILSNIVYWSFKTSLTTFFSFLFQFITQLISILNCSYADWAVDLYFSSVQDIVMAKYLYALCTVYHKEIHYSLEHTQMQLDEASYFGKKEDNPAAVQPVNKCSDGIP